MELLERNCGGTYLARARARVVHMAEGADAGRCASPAVAARPGPAWPGLDPQCSTGRSRSGQPRSFAPSTAACTVKRWAGEAGS
jgi:hypothetical protein